MPAARPTAPVSNPAGSRRPRPLGVTLVELVVALALTTIVVAAATSVMFVASRALPSTTDASVRATDAAMALAMLEAEAQCALQVRLQDDSLIFLVPDRTGDATADQIAYRWSGNAGDPLTRTMAGSTTDAVARVQKAAFGWTLARGSTTRVGTLYVELTLERSLVMRSTIRFPSEPENTL